MSTTRVGVYGGTFDPIHLGHLAVAECVRECASLDLVLFVANRQQPLKARGPWATAEQRLRMIEAAIAGNPAFAASDIELRHAGPSYTVDTLDALQREYPGSTLQFILGTDAANLLRAWREPGTILSRYRPLVMGRAGWPELDWEALERVRPDARNLVQLIDVPRLEIASSAIRSWIAEGRSIRYLVPDAVRTIIEREALYVSSEPA